MFFSKKYIPLGHGIPRKNGEKKHMLTLAWSRPWEQPATGSCYVYAVVCFAFVTPQPASPEQRQWSQTSNKKMNPTNVWSFLGTETDQMTLYVFLFFLENLSTLAFLFFQKFIHISYLYNYATKNYKGSRLSSCSNIFRRKKRLERKKSREPKADVTYSRAQMWTLLYHLCIAKSCPKT